MKGTYVGFVIDAGNDPGQSETEEYVDRVTSSDVTDGVIGVSLLTGRRFTGKQIG